MRDIHQITSTELLALKQQYDKDFLSYWRKPGGSSKFIPISMDAFKPRFFKPSQEESRGVKSNYFVEDLINLNWIE